jgi:hypothetical protein
LESVASEERNRHVQSELSKRELQSARQKAEVQLAEATSLQQTKLSSVSKMATELKLMQNENHLLKDEVGRLKDRLIDLTEQLRLADEDRVRMQLDMARNQRSPSPRRHPHSGVAEGSAVDEAHSGARKTPAPSHHYRSDLDDTTTNLVNSPSLLEQKIAKELSSTKKQLKKYEQMINDRMKTSGAAATIPPPPPLFSESAAAEQTRRSPSEQVAKGTLPLFHSFVKFSNTV